MSTPSYAPPATVALPTAASEVASAHSILRVSRLLAVVFGMIAVILAIIDLVLAGLAAAAGVFLAVPGYVGGAVYFVLAFFACLLIWSRTRRFESQLDSGQFAPAREGLLLWSIVGLIFGFVVIGVLLLLVYFKLDRILRGGLGTPMNVAGPASAPVAPATSGAAPSAPMGTGAPVTRCPRCGNPASFIAQYGRYYCYGCQQYL